MLVASRKTGPSVPWAFVVMALLLWSGCEYLNGKWWSKNTVLSVSRCDAQSDGIPDFQASRCTRLDSDLLYNGVAFRRHPASDWKRWRGHVVLDPCCADHHSYVVLLASSLQLRIASVITGNLRKRKVLLVLFSSNKPFAPSSNRVLPADRLMLETLLRDLLTRRKANFVNTHG